MRQRIHQTSATLHLVLILSLVLAFGVPQAWAAEDIVGDWQVIVESPWGPMQNTLTLEKGPDGLLAAKWGARAVSNVKFQNNQLTFARTIPMPNGDITLNFAGTLKDGKLTGTLSNDQGDSSVTGAKKKPAPPVVGVWDLAYKLGDRDITSKLVVSAKADGALGATWTSAMGESAISNVKLQEGKLTFDRTVKFNEREFKMTFEGTAEGDRLTGVSRSGNMGEIPVTGTRFGADLIGKWELTSVSDMGTWTTLMIVNPDLSGQYEFFSEVPMKDVKFENGQLTFGVEFGPEDQRFQMTFKGKVEGKTLKGQMTSDRGTSDVTGKKLPQPPAAPAVAR